MALRLGNNEITQIGKVKRGNDNVVRIYRGNDLVWPLGVSFGTGFNSLVRSIQIQSDGKILVGGSFTSYQGTTSNRIIRLNVEGSIDTSFNIGTGFNNGVRSIAIQSDNKIIVCGDFTTYNSTTSNRIIRLNTDGSVDTSFNVGTGFNNFTESVAIQLDGKLVIGGNFTAYQGASSNYIIRLNSDGSIDTSFNIGNGFDILVYSIQIQSDGKILVGGQFRFYQGVSANGIIRLNSDASRDTSFNIGTGIDNVVFSIQIQSDGKILVGGFFTAYQGVSARYIIRLNSDASRDTSFNIGTGFGNSVFSIQIQSDGKILVGGDFSGYQGVSANGIIRLNSDGSIDSSFNIGTGFSAVVRSIKLQSDGKILVGGNFTFYQGVSANRIIQLNSDGSRSSN
jgi:uncharacterized delta-60 repeat protein